MQLWHSPVSLRGRTFWKKKTCLGNLIKKRQDLTAFCSVSVQGNSVYNAWVCIYVWMPNKNSHGHFKICYSGRDLALKQQQSTRTGQLFWAVLAQLSLELTWPFNIHRRACITWLLYWNNSFNGPFTPLFAFKDSIKQNLQLTTRSIY